MISLIIPTHNRTQELYRLLQSISKQKFDFSRLELIVVSNLEDSTLKKTIQKLKDKIDNSQYLVVGSIGVNKARNLGIKNATKDILLFLDDDCLLEDTDYLKKVVLTHQQNPNYCGIGGFYHLSQQANTLAKAYHCICEKWLLDSILWEKDSINLVGGNASYKRVDIQNKINFSSEIIYGGAESDFNMRLHSKGKKLLLTSNLSITHLATLNLRKFLFKAFKQGFAYRRMQSHPDYMDYSTHPQKNSFRSLLQKLKLSKWQSMLILKFYIPLYEFCFHQGYCWAQESLYEDRPLAILLQVIKNKSNRAAQWTKNLPIIKEFCLSLQYHYQTQSRKK